MSVTTAPTEAVTCAARVPFVIELVWSGVEVATKEMVLGVTCAAVADVVVGVGWNGVEVAAMMEVIAGVHLPGLFSLTVLYCNGAYSSTNTVTYTNQR